jgi:hypothetical protein
MKTIDDFKSKLKGGGARPNLFKVIINYPAITQGDTELTSFLCKGAGLPGASFGEVAVAFRGRTVKFAGDRAAAENWTISVINDTDFAIRNAFERWQNIINSNVSNVGTQISDDYMVDLEVHQLDKAGNILKTYNLRGAFPLSVSQIEVSNDTADTIEDFTVDFSYQYWDSDTVN